MATGPSHWVLGMLANKQGPEIAAALLAPDDRAWIVPVPGHACWSLEALAAACPRLASQLNSAPSLEAGLAQAGSGSQRVVVAGSLYLLGQAATSEQAPAASPGTSDFG